MQADLKCAYLLVGSDELKKQEALDRLTAQFEGPYEEFSLEVIDASDKPLANQLLSSVNTLPVFTEKRLVVIKNIESLDKDASEALVRYLKEPLESTVLTGIAAKLAKNTRLYKAFAQQHPKAIICCEPKKSWELPAHLIELARARGLKLEKLAAQELVSRLGDSTLMLDTELNKLQMALGKHATIKLEDVEARVARVAEVKPWDFLDALCERRVDKALSLFKLMPSQNLMGLYVMTCSRIRELMIAKALSERGTPGMLAQELGMQAWQIKHHHRWAQAYTAAELEEILRAAAHCERLLKSTSDKTGAFIEWVLCFARRS